MMNRNNYSQQKIRGLKRKYEAIQKFGGKCINCGYNKNLAVLEFHHRNPDDKNFPLDIRKFSNTNLDALENELVKCDVLCSNCHREHHNPELEVKKVKELINHSNKTSFNNRKEKGRKCKACDKRFLKSKGKLYCSKQCREKDKNYPEMTLILEKYKELCSWEKVAIHFETTRSVIDRLRKLNEKL